VQRTPSGDPEVAVIAVGGGHTKVSSAPNGFGPSFAPTEVVKINEEPANEKVRTALAGDRRVGRRERGQGKRRSFSSQRRQST
jgi:hypothetical protein